MANIFESSAHQDGHRATESTHRKIELQSPADLTYLIANVSRAAREKLDKHLPPDALAGGAIGGGEDAMRKRVEELVEAYIRDTFNASKDSICVNGMEREELETEIAKAQEGEELEPFDTKLAQRIQALSAQIEHQTLQLANLRRKAPQETAVKFTESFEKQTGQFEKLLKADEAVRMEAARGVNVDVVGRGERVEEMQSTWQMGNERLAALKSGLGGTVARMEKAKKAVEVVEER